MSITRRRNEEEEDEVLVLPTYTPDELDVFGVWIDQFKKERTIKDFNTGVETKIRPIDMDEAMVSFGALKKYEIGGIVQYSVILDAVETDSYGGIRRYKRPTKYDLFYHKYYAWSNRRMKKEFALAQRNKEYAEMSEQMGEQKKVDTSSNEEDI